MQKYFAKALSVEMAQQSVRILLVGVVSIVLLLLVASLIHHRFHFTKKAFYGLISSIVLLTTTAFCFIQFNLLSRSEDFAIQRRVGSLSVYVCDQFLPILPYSKFLTATAGDSRHKIFENGHMEFLGYEVDDEKDGTLGEFFRAFGGSLSANIVTIPFGEDTASSVGNDIRLSNFVRTNPIGEQYLELRSGDSCFETPSMLSVFTYRYNTSLHGYVQEKLNDHPEQFRLSTQPFDEPDCVVMIFGDPTESTDLTCNGFPDKKQILPSLGGTN